MANLPDKDSAFWQSPALTRQSDIYPPRFRGRVPLRVCTPHRVTPDHPLTGEATEHEGVYLAWTNMHGAVVAILPQGDKLGLKPAEFEVAEWYDPPEGTCHRMPYRQQRR